MWGLRPKEIIRAVFPSRTKIPLGLHGLCAGFPSPADDYLDENIDIEQLLMPNSPATFLWRVNGHSMEDAGIFDGDICIIDRSVKAAKNDVVVVVVNGEITLKRLTFENGKPKLSCENKNFPKYTYPENAEIEVWGVVMHNIHSHRQRL